MKKYIILFSVGKDRPGIVDDISTFLFEHESNIEDSRMAVMGGYFSTMILLSCPADRRQALKDDLEDLRTLGLHTWLHDADDPTARLSQTGLPLHLNITSMDHPGIVKNVVQILRGHDVNIETLATQVSKAPLSGSPLFNLVLKAVVPPEASISTVKKELHELAAEINLDLNFSE